MLDFRVDYTTSCGFDGYIVVTAKNKASARTKAREQVVLNFGDIIKTMKVGVGQYYS